MDTLPLVTGTTFPEGIDVEILLELLLYIAFPLEAFITLKLFI